MICYFPIRFYAFPAYDCSNPLSRAVDIDLTEAAECPTYEETYKPPVDHQIALVQAQGTVDVDILQCKVEVTSSMYGCGFDSIAYGHKWLEWMRTVEITPSRCRTAYRDGEINLFESIFPITRNITSTVIHKRDGMSDETNWCQGSSFTFEGKSYYNSVRTSNYKIRVGYRRSRHLVSSELLRVSGDILFPAKDTVGIDAIEGTFIWTLSTDRCQNEMRIIYAGISQLSLPQKNEQSPEIYIIKDSKQGRYGGFYSNGVRSLCGHGMVQTQKEGLFIIKNVDPQNLPLIGSNARVNVDYSQDMASAIGFAALTSRLDLNQAIVEIKTEICKVYKSQLESDLMMLRHHSSGALLRNHGYNHSMVLISGAVAHITPCRQVEVTPRDPQTCTQEIPVKFNGTDMYADPFTMILAPNATSTACTGIAPIKWKINRLWFCSTPKIVECSSPTKLSPATLLISSHKVQTEGIGAGMFTEEDRLAFAKRAYQDNSRKSFTNKAARTYSGEVTGGKTFLTLIGDEGKDTLSDDLRYSFFPMLHWMGDFGGYFTGGCFFLGLVIVCIQFVIRAIFLIREHGCSWRLVGLFGDTIMVFVSIPAMVIRKVIQASLERSKEAMSPAVSDRGPSVVKNTRTKGIDLGPLYDQWDGSMELRSSRSGSDQF